LRLHEPKRSQEDVAFSAGITAGALAKIELGRSSPEWRTVRSIARALGVGLVELAQMIESAEVRE
jgi:transcriptional regulator with XRE-family HTH domain